MKRLPPRWLPSPLLSAVLLALWLTLNNTLAIGHIVLGALLAVGVPLIAGRWRDEVLPLSDTPAGEGADGFARGAVAANVPRRGFGHRLAAALRLLLRVLGDIVLANLSVARRIAFVPERQMAPGFLLIELRLRTPGAIGALAAIITLTPGTVSTDVLPPETQDSPPRLLVHALDMPDAEALAAEIRTRYEAPLLEVFE